MAFELPLVDLGANTFAIFLVDRLAYQEKVRRRNIAHHDLHGAKES